MPMPRRYRPYERYSQQKKTAYIALCRRYNHALKHFELDNTAFIALSLQLHQAKGDVPVKWRTAAFVARCGLPA